MDKANLIDLLIKNKNIEQLYKYIDNIKMDISLPDKPYTFLKDRIYCDDIYEIFIIYWKEGYTSPVHSHAENGCILYLVDGHLHETVYNNSTIINEKSILCFQKSFINNNIGVHKIKAITDSISIHIYSPPDSNANIYQYKDIQTNII
jgi:cysteine dioxygenase